MFRLRRSFVAFLGLAVIGTGSADAAILLAAPINGTVGNGVATGSALTVTPNNYPSASTSNNLTTSVSLSTSPGPLDLVIAATNSGGITQYTVTVSVINGTGAALNSYEFQFGSGTGSGFSPSNSLAFFTTPPNPTSPAFTTATETAGDLLFTGGSLANGATTSFTFAIGVKDTAGGVGTPFTFSFREGPSAVPEPASLLLTAMGGLAIAAATRLRRRAR